MNIKCSTCGGLYPSASYYVWFRHTQSKEHQFALACEKLKNEVNLFNDRMKELGLKISATHEIRNLEVKPELPEFNSLKKCQKCGESFIAKKVETLYDETSDRMERWCPNCSYKWFEKPMDTLSKATYPYRMTLVPNTVSYKRVYALLKHHKDLLHEAFGELREKNMPGDYYSMDFQPFNKVFAELNTDIEKFTELPMHGESIMTDDDIDRLR